MRLAKSEFQAKSLFKAMLERAVDGKNLIWIVAEKEQLALVPNGAIRILMTADLGIIKERFSKRIGKELPLPILAMLERKHGIFDKEQCDFHIDSNDSMEEIINEILK